jgi:hypothetical protein
MLQSTLQNNSLQPCYNPHFNIILLNLAIIHISNFKTTLHNQFLQPYSDTTLCSLVSIINISNQLFVTNCCNPFSEMTLCNLGTIHISKQLSITNCCHPHFEQLSATFLQSTFQNNSLQPCSSTFQIKSSHFSTIHISKQLYNCATIIKLK